MNLDLLVYSWLIIAVAAMHHVFRNSVCVCAPAVRDQVVQEQEQLLQKCLHLQSRLDAAQAECQREREVREGQEIKAEFKPLYFSHYRLT